MRGQRVKVKATGEKGRIVQETSKLVQIDLDDMKAFSRTIYNSWEVEEIQE